MRLATGPARPTSLRRRLAAVVTALALVGTTAALAAPPAQAAPPAAAGSQGYGGYGGRGGSVALGDSFASGEGLAPYLAGTDSATDQCHRSAQAYPALLGQGRSAVLRTLRFVACSGATTAAVVAEVPGDKDPDGAQLRALRRSTRTVTLTVGGNDIGFAPVLASCVYTPVADPALQQLVPGRPGCAAAADPVVSARTARLAGAVPAAAVPGTLSIAEVLAAVHAAAPWATVYVTGYPRLFGLSSTDPLGCQVGSVGPAPLYVSNADLRWIRSKVDGLNAAIAAGVGQARAAGVKARYVDVSDAFTSHNVCSSGTPWVNGLVLGGTPTAPALSPASFHPTARGQQAYADALRAAARR